jgi:hypothetical protein
MAQRQHRHVNTGASRGLVRKECKMKRSIAAIGLGLVAIASTTFAGDGRQFGPRTLAMGGAGVASARGAWSLMCNPAGLAENDVGAASRRTFDFSAGWRDLGLSEAFNSLSDYDWEAIQDDPARHPADILAIVGELEALNRGKGLMLDAGGTAALKLGAFGVGVGYGWSFAFRPSIDLNNINPTEGDANSFSNNQSGVFVKALNLTEVPIGYGHTFDLGAGSISIGGAVKLMKGVAYDEKIDPNLANSDDVRDEIRRSETTSTKFGVDLGAIYHAPAGGLSIGFVAKNINNPKFETNPGYGTGTGAGISEKAQMRVGAEWALWDRMVCIAVDADLNKRESMMDIYNGPGAPLGTYKEQWVGGGISLEGTPWIFALGARVGAMQNIAEDENGLLLTGGVSIGFKWLHLNIAAAKSDKETTIEGSNLPVEGTAMLSIESTW